LLEFGENAQFGGSRDNYYGDVDQSVKKTTIGDYYDKSKYA